MTRAVSDQAHTRAERFLDSARAIITEILTAHFFVTHPNYLDTMLKLRDVQLRI